MSVELRGGIPLGRRLKKAEIQFIEHKLREYPLNKTIIREYEEQRNNIFGELGTGTPSDGQPRGGGIGRPTEATAIQLAMLESVATCELFWVKAIDDVLSILPSEEKEYVELRYFKGFASNVSVAMALGIDERDIYRWRDRILPKFAKRFGLVI